MDVYIDSRFVDDFVAGMPGNPAIDRSS